MVVCREKCHICGKEADFEIGSNATLLRDARCSFCGTTVRTSDLVGEILKNYGGRYASLEEAGENLPVKSIVNASTSGFVHEYFKMYSGYICGEYFDDVKSGEYKQGTLCMDLCSLPFGSSSVDLVISEDVFEHIFDYSKALIELNRVLKIGGKHIFTVPIHEGRKTVSRINNKRIICHGDPIRPESGCMVCTDFGSDIIEIMRQYGFESYITLVHKFFDAEEITDCDKTYDEYLMKQDRLDEYFKYNSIVVVAEKINCIGDEILRPNQLLTNVDLLMNANESDYEYLHRFYAIEKLVVGKNVLNIGFDEGYGAYLLAGEANNVVSICDNITAIESAQKKYSHKDNLRFLYSSYEKMSKISDASIDVVVAFSLIEYLDEACVEKLLAEIRRVLRSDGVLVVSTPDKMGYVDKNQNTNVYVKKVYTYDECKKVIVDKFKYVNEYRQSKEIVSVIKDYSGTELQVQYYDDSLMYDFTANCNIFIASDSEKSMQPISSMCMNDTNEYYLLKRKMQSYVQKLERKEQIIKQQEEELERRLQELENRMELINQLRRQVSEATQMEVCEKKEERCVIKSIKGFFKKQ